MIIDRIRLINFLSHEDSEIFFDTGVNIIVGHNGAGKSSIIDAIRFALFGDKRTKKIEDMIRKGAKSLEVEMEFRHGGHTYIIRRSITRRSKNPESNAMIMVDGSALSQSVKDANDYIEKNIITKSKDVFLNSVFSKQGEMDDLISGDPARRKKLLDEILEIEKLEETYDVLKDVIDSLQAGISNLDYLISENERDRDDLRRYQDDVAELSKQIDQEEAIESDLLRKKEEASAEYNAVSKELIMLDATLKNMMSLSDEANRYEEEIRKIDGKLQEISGSTERYNEITSSKVYASRERIRGYWTDKGQIIDYRKMLKNIDGQVQSYEDNMKKAAELQADHDQYEIMQRRMDEIKHELDDLRTYESKYVSLINEIEQKKKKREEYRKKQKDLGDEISRTLGRAFANASELVAIYEEIRRDIDEINTDLGNLQVKIGALRQKEEEIRRNMNMLEGHNKCPVCGTDLGDEGSRRIREHYSEDLNRLNEEIDHLEREASAIDEKKRQLISMESYLAKGKIREYETYDRQMKDLEAQITDDENSLSTIAYKHTKYEQLDEEYRSMHLEDLRQKYTDWNNAMAVISNIGDIEALRKQKDEVSKKLKDAEDRTHEIESEFPDINSYTPSYIGKIEDEVRLLEPQIKLAEDLKRQRETLREKVKDLRSRSAGMDEIQKRKNELSVKASESETRLKYVEGQIQATLSSLSGKRSKVETLRSHVSEIEQRISDRERDIERMK
ncbi:MAG: DNA double-strand break repair ATPase Rad50, partial [Thermoplasma acidophilum]|nr:DNA double-strand break repair ATPase Rad50 [Thermoplasma acidophilum]